MYVYNLKRIVMLQVNCRSTEQRLLKSLDSIEEMKSRTRRSPDVDTDDLLDNIKSSLSDTAQSVRKGISTVIQDVKKSDTYESVKTGLNNLGDQFKKVGSQIQQKIEDKLD